MTDERRVKETYVRLQNLHHKDFEHFISDLWEYDGWVTEVVGGPGDGGRDVIATKHERTMRTKVVIQARRYKNKIQPKDIREVNSVTDLYSDIDAVVLATTSTFSDNAFKDANHLNVHLWDGYRLCVYVLENDLKSVLDEYAPPFSELPLSHEGVEVESTLNEQNYFELDYSEEISHKFAEQDILNALEELDEYRIGRDRVKAIIRLRQIVENNCLETEVVEFFADNPYLLDPTWSNAKFERTLTDSLQEEFSEIEFKQENYRPDIFALGYQDVIEIVELKQPGRKIGWDEVKQATTYTKYARNQLSESDNRKKVGCQLIADGFSDDAEKWHHINKMREFGIQIRHYNSIILEAVKSNQAVIDLVERNSKSVGNTELLEEIKKLKSYIGND